MFFLTCQLILFIDTEEYHSRAKITQIRCDCFKTKILETSHGLLILRGASETELERASFPSYDFLVARPKN